MRDFLIIWVFSFLLMMLLFIAFYPEKAGKSFRELKTKFNMGYSDTTKNK